MNSEFRIIRIHGIDIKAGWSLVIIGAFISLSLAAGYFPALLPGWSIFVYLAAALFSLIGLYASVLLNELSHALVAQRQGLKVKSIVLNLFGGVTDLKEESPSPRLAFWLAISGPLTNLGLAIILFGVTQLTTPSNPVISAIAFYLMGINFLLGVLNLLPAYPLDGGKYYMRLFWVALKAH